MKLKEFIANLKKGVADMREKSNAALAKFKPLDQAELSREALWGLNYMEYSIASLEDIAKKIDDKEANLDAEIAAEAQSAIDAKVAAGEFVAKDKVEAAIAAARTEEQNAATDRIAAAVAAVKVVTTRRAAIAEKHGAEVAAKLTDEQLAGDDAAFTEFSTELDRRVTALCEIGVTATDKPASFQRIACGIAFDADGIKAFDTELESVRELAGNGNRQAGSTAASLQTTGKLPGSGQPPAAGGGNGGGNRQTTATEDEEPAYGF